MKNLDKILIKFLILSLILFVFSLFFSKNGKNTPKAIDSAILNPRHSSEISQIEINVPYQEDGSIIFKKQGDFWLLEKDLPSGEKIISQADSAIIESFIKNSSKIRKLYKVSDKSSDYESFSVSENSGIAVSFTGNNSKMYTKVHFGHSDSLKNRIYFRSEASKITYECENDFQQYLTTETNYWSEGKIIPEIKNPVQITVKMNESSIAQSSKMKRLDEKSSGFAYKSNTLLSLRHGQIRPEIAINSANYISTLSVQDGSGRMAKLDFFKKQKGEDESYFYRKSIQPSPVDSQENTFAFYSEKSAYEISAWTYEKIVQTVLTAE
ncbi:MAG: hypothetical protein SPL22_09130 [Treponema sp.]|uniref:hypothetical protein n=1 Tax=Treponema sp. TaxID=166 RepID=UPI002A9187C9|nr:hypothetical protein [Treponema sp.]MDY6397884.1 hypothetical protein [Treponema sp.]